MNIAIAAPEPLVSYHSTQVDGLEIFYREAGPKDAPTILLLHGLPSSSRMYQSLLESSHFALDLKSKEIVQLMGEFMKNAL
jgi:pimeloyl-ACP methyl ester carboxylesterase